MRLFGLIGYPLGHSFSKTYFTEKFEKEGITDARYELFPLPDVNMLPELLEREPELCGLNVTIPHKQAVIPFLHRLDAGAEAVGAVNTIRIRHGLLEGFNTDVIGFEQSLRRWLAQLGGSAPAHTWVLGSGGAALAVCAVLKKLGYAYKVVSRNPKQPGEVSWATLGQEAGHSERVLWINTTPLGMAPKTDTCPPIPFHALKAEDLVYDLVYNPAETLLLQHAGTLGCAVKNGLEMLHLQAEAAWEIWNA
jgi:shikimate dehydrogenase